MSAGVVDCHHNLANAYREQGALDKALATADQAVTEAEATHDDTLYAMTLRGRAEIRALRSEPELARRDLDRIRVIRGQLPDPVAEAEDLRIQALVMIAEDEQVRAEKSLREVVGRAELHERQLLQGEATRDLSNLLRRAGRTSEAQAAAQTARGIFARMGAESEIRRDLRHHRIDGANAQRRTEDQEADDVERSIHVGTWRRSSWAHVNPTARTTNAPNRIVGSAPPWANPKPYTTGPIAWPR